MGDQIGEVLYKNFLKSREENTHIFTEPKYPGTSKEVMVRNYFLELADFHKSAVHSIHTGTPLHGLHGTVKLAEIKDTVDLKNKDSLLKVLDAIVERI